MNTINSIISTTLSSAGETFYARTISSSATEEREVANAINDESEIGSGIMDTLYGVFVKGFPQTLLTVGLTQQIHSHLITIGASENALAVSHLAGRFLPSLPIMLAAGPILGFMYGLSANDGKIDGQTPQNAADGLSIGRTFQKMGRWTGRVLELTYAGLLVSRLVQNDRRIEALASVAVLTAGVIYRYDVLKEHLPSAHAAIDRIFTWKPTWVPYALGGAAIVSGPSRVVALALTMIQGMRDLVLSQGEDEAKSEKEEKAI